MAYQGERAPLDQALQTTVPRPAVGRRPEPTDSVRTLDRSSRARLTGMRLGKAAPPRRDMNEVKLAGFLDKLLEEAAA